MAKVLESLIAKGRRARRPPEQKEVAFGLADLSTHEELLERMVQKGGVKSLLILLSQSTDTDAQRFSALALGNVASAAFNRSRMAGEGTIPMVIEYMKNPENDIVARQYCAMTLGNLAAEPENHMEIIKSDGIDALITVLKSEDIEGGRYAAFAISNLAANANHRERIVEQGAVPCLVSLACCEDINAQRQAMSALRAICISPEFRAIVVREGVLDPLVLMSRSEDIMILREVAAAINNLSSVEENKMEVSDRAMCTIIGLMLSGDNIVERHAVCSAANLMESMELNSRLVEERGIAPLVALASNDDPNSRGEACRCLANLSVNPDVHQILIKEGALPALVGSLESPELNCQRYASLALANLATTVAAQVKIIQSGAIRPFINLALNPVNQIEARRYAVLSLANLTATTANHMTIIEDGGIAALLSLCNSPDLMSQYYVGCALANLSCSITNHPIIIEAGGAQAIIALASSSDPDVHQQAVAALRGLSVTFSNKMKIVQEGALTPLTHLLTSDDVEILREVVATFSNLSVCDENKYEIVKAGAVAALISLSQSTDMIVSSQSCATLANLAELTINQESLAKEGAVRPCITVMRSKYIEVQREAGRLLANLCASTSEFTNTVIEGGGHNLLISYLLSNDTACQRVGSMGICNLCTQARFREILIESGVLEPLCSLARSEDVELEIQRYAVLAIANLASASENHKTFVQDGTLSMLISLSTANDAEIRQYAAYACTKLAQNADVRTIVTEAGGLEPVLYLARTDEPEIQRQVLPALCCLSFHDSNKVPICRHGGLDVVVRAIRDSVADNSRLACCTIANLAEMAINFDLIADSGAIPNLVQILNSPSEEVKRESARALGNLAANIELGDVILREGALQFLIPMIRSSDYLTQRMAAMALCNLSSNIRNQQFMLGNGLFEPLLHETQLALDPKSKSDHECTRYCLLTFSNLAVNPANQGMLMKYALQTFSDFSKHRDIKCRQHAVFCIGNLCSNPDNLEDIMSSGVLKTLITYAFPGSDSSSNVQFQAVAALRGLATHPILRVQLIRDGVIEPLIMATKSQSIEVQREAAAAICNLAMSEENKVTLARSGVLPALIQLAMSNDNQRELHSIAALANMAEMVEGRTQERMIEEGVMKPLMRLSDSPSPEIRREIARNFALFASKKDSHNVLIRIHAVTKMLLFLNDPDEVAKRYGVLAIGNLAISREAHQELFDTGCIATLIDVVKHTPDIMTKRAIAFTFHNIASNPGNHNICERLGLTRALIILLQDADKDTNLQATLATRRLCESPKFRNQFIDLNGIPLLLALGLNEDVEVKREIAAALRNLSLSIHGKVVMMREKGLVLLGELLQSPDVEICHQATGVIANLAEASENQSLMVDEGIIQQLKYVLRSKSIDVQREACRALANLSAEYTYAPIIVAAGTLQSLISGLGSPDYLCQRYAAMGLGNLACHPSNQKKILQEGALPFLISLGKYENGDLESQRYSLLALTNLTGSKANHLTLIQTNCLSLFKTFLDHQDIEIRNTSLFAIANLSANPNNHQLILQEGCLPKIVSMLNIPDPQLQLRAVSALRGLSTDEQIRLDIVELKAIEPVLTLAKSTDVELQMESLACLCNLSLCGCIGDNPLAFLDSVSMQNLITYLCSADSTFRLFGAVTIGNIASQLPLQDTVMSSGALAPLITISNQSDIETQRCIAYALVNLAADPKRRRDIVREGGLTPLISLACSEDIQDALVALSAIRGIVSQPENRRDCYKANLAEALTLNTRVNSLENRAETAAIINAISINDENKLEMALQDVFLQNIICLLQDNDHPRILRPAMGSLANLSERQECHPFLRKFQIHNLILSHFYNEDIGLLREATRCLTNLASVHDNHPPIVSGGGVQAFLHTANHPDSLVTRFSTLGLLNLTTLPENHFDLINGSVFETLININNRDQRELIMLDALGERLPLSNEGNVQSYSQSKDAQESKSDNILNYPETIDGDSKFILENGYDLESCRYSALALGNLAMTKSCHIHLMNDKCIQALNICLTLPDAETRFNAAFALNKLAIEHANIEYLGQSKIIPNLIQLLVVPNEFECKGQVVACLRHLSYHIDNRFMMLEQLLFQPLGQLIADLTRMNENPGNLAVKPPMTANSALSTAPSSPSRPMTTTTVSTISASAAVITGGGEVVYNTNEILRELTALTTQLSLSDGLRYPMCSSLLLSEICKLMSHVDVEIGRFSCATIANLSEAKRAHKILVSIGNVIHIFISLMRSKHTAIARESARGISNLMSSKASHRLFLEDNGLLSLFRLCRAVDEEILHHCALVFRKLTPIISNHEFIISKGGLTPLLILASNHNLSIKLQATAAIRDLSSNLQFKTVLAEEGGLKKAILLAQDDVSLELRILGMGILRHLSINTRIKRPIVLEHGLTAVFKAIEDETQDLDLLRQTSSVVANVSENGENQITLIQEQILPRLIFLSKIQSLEIHTNIAKTFAQLTSNLENQVNVFGSDEIVTMINIMNYHLYEENCNRDLLISLGNLAINHKNQLMIMNLGVFPLLMHYINSEYESIIIYTVRLLYRLAANPLLQEQMVQSQLITRLNTLLRHPNMLIRKYILMVYCNLSSNVNNKLKLTELGVLAPVIANLSNEEEVISRYAAMCCINLSTEATNQVLIAQLNGLIELILLASKENAESARFAGMSLANLATNRVNRLAIVNQKGLVPLIAMAYSKNPETQRAAGLAFYNLSCAVSNHIPMVQNDIIPALSHLGKSEDLDCKTYSIMSLANLASNVETRLQSTRSGALQTAIALLKDPDLNVQRYACIALCNMGNHTTTQEQIVVHGALPSILQMAYGVNWTPYSHGNSKFSLKFDLIHHQQQIMKKQSSPDQSPTHSLPNSRPPTSPDRKLPSGGEDKLKATSQLVSTPNKETTNAIREQDDEYGGESSDIETQRLALLTLSNLASNELNHAALVNKGYLTICMNAFANSTDEDIRSYAAFGIANMCSNPDYIALIGRQGGVPLLIYLTKSANPNVLSLGLSGLRRLANHEENWMLLLQYNILDSLASAGMSQYLEIQREVAATLCSLSLIPSSQAKIEIAYKCLPALVQLATIASKKYQILLENHQNALKQLGQPGTTSTVDYNISEASMQATTNATNIFEQMQINEKQEREKNFTIHSQSYVDIARQSIGAMANLAEEIETHEYLAKANASTVIVTLQSFPQIDIQRESTRCISNLLSSFRHQAYVINEGIVGLINLSNSTSDEECLYHCALAFRKLTPNIQSHAMIVYNQGYPAIFRLIAQPYLTTQIQALTALRDLSANQDFKIKCIEDNGLKTLVPLLSHSNENVIILALSCLRHLSLETSIKHPIILEKCIRLILKNINLNIEDMNLQIAGLLANLSEEFMNQSIMVEEGICLGILNLVHKQNEEIQQDISRCIANLTSNEELHVMLYKQGILNACIHLIQTNKSDITTKYAAMGLRFLACNPVVRVHIVKNKEIGIYNDLSKPENCLEYKRTAANAFASFTLHEENKILLVQTDQCIPSILNLIHNNNDLAILRDSIFALANLTDTPMIQHDLLQDDLLIILKELTLKSNDIKIQRDLSRCYVNLSASTDEIKTQMIQTQSMEAILILSKSLDALTQRYSSLAICNLCSLPTCKEQLIEESSLIKSIIFLCKFPDPEIQRYAALSLAGLALGSKGEKKIHLIQEGVMKPLLDLLLYANEHVVLSSLLALNAMVLGNEILPKANILTENGIPVILNLLSQLDSFMFSSTQVVNAILYLLGSICEYDENKLQFVEMHGISLVVKYLNLGDIDMKRSAGYCLANITEQVEYHNDLDNEGALAAIISLAILEDIECQEYSAFSLAHLATNRDLQVKLVQLGAVRPLVTMLSSDAEPKHYAGLALLKLADNFENHLKIAEEGGIQALLRLGRTRITDEQLQYKAALTLGQLATNAVKLFPGNNTSSSADGGMLRSSTASSIAPISHMTMNNLSATQADSDALGLTAKIAENTIMLSNKQQIKSRVTEKIRNHIQAQKDFAANQTMNYLNKSLEQTETEKQLSVSASLPALKPLKKIDFKDDIGATGNFAAANTNTNPHLLSQSLNFDVKIDPLAAETKNLFSK